MSRRTRRALLRAAVVGSLTAVAGCLGGDSDDGSSEPTSSDDSADESSEPTGGDTATLGDETFYRWLPAPIGDETEGYGFRYFDTARLREVADLFPEESFGSSGADIIPGGGTVDEQMIFSRSAVAQSPEYPGIEPVQIFLGEFDQEEVTAAVEDRDGADWDSRTEYGDRTLFVDERIDSEPGRTWGVGPSLFLTATHVLEDQGTRVAERFIDASEGQAPHVREVSDDVETMLEALSGETIVEFFYGDAYSGGNSGDGPLGVVQSYTITRETTDRQFIVGFRDGVDSGVVDEITTGFTERGYGDVSRSEEGSFVTITGTAQTDAIDRIQSLL